MVAILPPPSFTSLSPHLKQMETILSSPSSIPIPYRKSFSFQFTPSPVAPLSSSVVCSALKKPGLSPSSHYSSSKKDWASCLRHGLAAAAVSMVINFCQLPLTAGPVMASEFDVLYEGPPSESYVIDDAGVLSRLTESDLKNLLSDLESRKNLHINFITVRKLTMPLSMLTNSWKPGIRQLKMVIIRSCCACYNSEGRGNNRWASFHSSCWRKYSKCNCGRESSCSCN
ncbi:hypothetical protein HPP92_006685 [Vanilla planifolia]|uniref:TPM domain-containing protein n=1 Tax=Vanilla planifolia TaxID=51239 RepID=A0A835RPP7_VANPL|nr:hypothetical protein HPP92_006685 [Vanilla planifolia]